MVYPHTKFHVSGSNDSAVIAIKQSKSTVHFVQQACFTLNKNIFIKSCLGTLLFETFNMPTTLVLLMV